MKNNQKIALITGVNGQDGAYLAELLLKKNYIVHGVKRRSSSINTFRVDHIYQDPHEKNYKFRLHYGDITDSSSVSSIIKKTKPDEIYNLAAQSHVAVSFEVPEYTANADALGPLRILEAIKFHKLQNKTKFYQAGTSEMFGKVQQTPQTEKTPFYPKSPYAVSKVYAHWITKNYRESYNMFACNGILFNHESPRRGFEFVTRKISLAVAKIKNNLQKELRLGNLEAKRDWGHARDYIEAMWLMLQQNDPEDYVIGTGEQHSVKEFLEIAFNHVNLNYQDYVKIDKAFFRPAEVETLLADPFNAKKKLKWSPKINFENLVKEMVESDLKNVKDKVI